MMTLETRALRYFVTVADELHFGRAATRLNIVQPALSMQIKALEERLGSRLLERSRQEVRLTAAGQLFLEEARRALAQVEHAEAIGRRAASGEIGLLTIGHVGSAPFSGLMARTIAAFHAAYPGVEIVLTELDVAIQIGQLQAGALDAAFVRLPLATVAPGLVIVAREVERIVVAMPSTHRLAGQTEIAPADLAGETFVKAAAHAHAGLAALFWRVCGDGGFMPKIAQSLPQIPAVISLVAAGLGVSLVPETIQSMALEGVAYRPLAGADYTSDLALMVRADAQPLARNFARLAAA